MYGQNYGYGQPQEESRRLNGPLGAVAGGFTTYKKWKNGFGAAGNLLTGDLSGALVDGAQAYGWGKAHDYLREPRLSHGSGGYQGRPQRLSHGAMNGGFGGGAGGYGGQQMYSGAYSGQQTYGGSYGGYY